MAGLKNGYLITETTDGNNIPVPDNNQAILFIDSSNNVYIKNNTNTKVISGSNSGITNISSWFMSGSYLGFPATVAHLSGNELFDVLRVGNKISLYTVDSFNVGGLTSSETNGFVVENISGTVTLRSTDPEGGELTLLAKRSITDNADTSIVLQQSPFDESPFIVMNTKTISMNLQGGFDQISYIRLVPTSTTDLPVALSGSGSVNTNQVLFFDSTQNRPMVGANTIAYLSDVASASILSGVIPCSAGVTDYTISHTQIDAAGSVPVVSIESTGNFYRYRICNRSSTSFCVVLDASPVDGENILYHLTYIPYVEIDYWITENIDEFVVDENGDLIELN